MRTDSFIHLGVLLKEAAPLDETVRLVETLGRPTPCSILVKAVQHCIAEKNVELLVKVVQHCIAEKNVELGKRLHAVIVGNGLGSNSYLHDHLIRLFAACDDLQNANRVFGGVVKPTVYTWNAIISAHAKLGDYGGVFELYKKMLQRDMNPSKVTFLYLLKSCRSVKASNYGRLLHHQILEGRVHTDVAIGSTLVDMYCKCGNIEDGCRVFTMLANRNSVSWGAMITGHVQKGHFFSAFKLFEMMIHSTDPDKHTFSCILKACGLAGSTQQGHIVHHKIIACALESDLVIGNTLVDMYAKCGQLHEAQNVFNSLPECNIVSWGTLISSYVQHGEGLSALDLFYELQQARIQLSPCIFSMVLKACGIVKDINKNKLLHEQILQDGFESVLVVGNALIDTYIKCSKLKAAHKVFDLLPCKNSISWGILISGYVQEDNGAIALVLFSKMQELGIIPDELVYLSVLKACACIRSVNFGLIIHDQIIKKEEDMGDMNKKALVDMYVKCSWLEEAQRVFNTVLIKDKALWNVMIVGYVHHGDCIAALKVFMDMQEVGIKADEFIFSCTLKACGGIGAMGYGRWIHNRIIKEELDANIIVGSALVEMYTCFQSLEEAIIVFNGLSHRNEVTWGTMITGYAQTGDCDKVREFFRSMEARGVKLNEVIMTSAVAACSHAGVLGEGLSYFDILQRSNGSMLSIKEYSCMVDLLSRTGEFVAAKCLIETMPMLPDSFVWASLLACSKTHGNYETVEKCIHGFFE